MTKYLSQISFVASRIFIVPFLFIQVVHADELSELKKEVAELKAAVQELKNITKNQQQVINSFKEVKASEPIVTSSNVSISNTASTTPPATTAPFIPEIGVVADITGSLSESKEDEEGNDRFSVREVELIIGHDIDPFSRFDSTITFSDAEEPSVEEAYVSYWDLPADLKARFGRIRPKVGKAATLHRDVLDTVDEPLVVQRYFGFEGLSRTGFELSGFTPLSADSFTQQITGAILEGGVGEGANLFGDSRRSPSLVGHVSNFLEISEESNLELGGTYLLGSNQENSKFKVNSLGLDTTFTHYFNPVNKLKILSEAYFQARDSGSIQLDDDQESFEHPWGFYTLADYRLNQQWGIGARYDYVEPIQNSIDNARQEERALSGYLTFYQSEFARWRIEYQHANLLSDLDDDRVFLQGTFAIGTHKHQIQ